MFRLDLQFLPILWVTRGMEEERMGLTAPARNAHVMLHLKSCHEFIISDVLIMVTIIIRAGQCSEPVQVAAVPLCDLCHASGTYRHEVKQKRCPVNIGS